MAEEKMLSIDAAHRYFGVEFNNAVFAFSDKENLSDEEKDEVVSTAHASLLHWQKFSKHQKVNTQRGLYMIAKAYVLVEDRLNAWNYANKCLKFTTTHLSEMQDFDLAYCHEMMARTAALNGNKEAFEKHSSLLEDACKLVKNEEDLKWVNKDVEGGSWFGMK